MPPIQRVDYVPLPAVIPRRVVDTRTLGDLLRRQGDSALQLELSRGQNAAQMWRQLGQVFSSYAQGTRADQANAAALAERKRQADVDDQIKRDELAQRKAERDEAERVKREAQDRQDRMDAEKRGDQVAESVGYGPVSEATLGELLQSPAQAARTRYAFGPGTAEGPELLPTRDQQALIDFKRDVEAKGGMVSPTGAIHMPPKPEPPPRPVSVPDGGRIVDPVSGKVIYQAPPKVKEGADDVTTLTPAGLDAAALNYAKTGMLPPLGMGDKDTRKQIINRAAAMMPGLDIASAKADFEANKGSLNAIQKQRDALGAFEETALKNLKVFTDLAAKIPDTGSPALNQPLRYANEKMFGGDTLTAYNTARRTVIPEFAKILANPGLSGQLSDSARKEVEDVVVSGNATLKQTMAAARVLMQDTKNRRDSYDDQIAGIKARIQKGQSKDAGTTQVGAFTVKVKP